MRYLFRGSSVNILDVFASSNVLVAFDYDGTLAPICSQPGRAAMRPSTRRLLRRVAQLYPCVVISGRGRVDALRRLHGVPLCRVVGNHGAEPSVGGAAVRRRIRQWLAVLESRLAREQGISIEHKTYSLAIHYREARQKRAARRAILDAAQLLSGVRRVDGKLSVNLLSAEAQHKGLALERERTHFACDTVIYVGDDQTDEDVFRLRRVWPLLSIRVGEHRRSSADYYIRDQRQIDRLLRSLAAVRGRHADQ